MFLVVCFLVLIVAGCSKGSPVVPPGEDSSDNELIRGPFWQFPDVEISKEVWAEKKVDVTNVILGADYMNKNPDPPWNWDNGKRGYILKASDHIPDANNPAELNVVAWSAKETDYWNVYFKVYGSVNGQPIISSDSTMVPNPTGANQSYPAVTAHIRLDKLLYIDIVYQKRYSDPDFRSIDHVQFKQAFPGNYDHFTVNISPNTVVSQITNTYPLHPDIVYATFYDDSFPGFPPPPSWTDTDLLVVTYELYNPDGVPNPTRQIWRAETAVDQPPNWQFFPVYDGSSGQGWYPRIDAGIDNADNGDDNFIVGIVWHVYEGVGVHVHYWDRVYNSATPTETYWGSIDYNAGNQSHPNGVPYIDIDPLENRLDTSPQHSNYAHIVWSRFQQLDGSDIEPFYRNSWEIYNTGGNPQVWSIADSGPYREGLPTIATYANQNSKGPGEVGTIQYISQTSGVYPVKSVTIGFAGYNPGLPVFGGSVQMSTGYASDAGPPWVYGPSNAIRGVNTTVCAWTETSYSSSPDIFGDEDL